MSAEAGAAAGGALVKYIGLPLLLGSLAAALGFLILPPKTQKEFVSRLTVTIIFSALFGPLLFFWFLSCFPGVMNAAVAESGLARWYIGMMLSAPFLVIGGLPGWWLLGGVIRWMDKRKDKDIEEIATDAVNAYKRLRP